MRTLKELLKIPETDTWDVKDVLCTIIAISPEFKGFEKHPVMKCVVASEDTKTTMTLRVPSAIKVLTKRKADIKEHGAALTLSNFKRQSNCIITSSKTICELDFEDVPQTSCTASDSDLYSDIIGIEQIRDEHHKTMFSVTGVIQQIYLALDASTPRASLVVGAEDDPTENIRITLWRDKAEIAQDLKTNQIITLYDLLLDKAGEKYRGLAKKAVKCTYTSFISVGHELVEDKPIKLISLHSHDGSLKRYSAPLTGRLVALGEKFAVRDTKMQKCVIADGDIGAVVLLHDSLIELPVDFQQQPVQLTLRGFVWRDDVIRVDKDSDLEIGHDDIPNVAEKNWKMMLYATECDFATASLAAVKTRVSITGRVKSVSSSSGRLIVILHDKEEKTARIVFWEDHLPQEQFEIGKQYKIFDVRVGNPTYRSGCTVSLDSTSASTFEKVTMETGIKQTSPAKITGICEKQAIVRIGSVRRSLFCDDELLHQIEDIFPCSGIAEYTEDTLTSFAVQ